MKKISFFIAALFAVVVCSKAQNTSPFWSLAGNSNATSSSKLGTTNGENLRIFTNNLERMRITSSGQVGIGISNPFNILTVKSGGGTPANFWLNGLNSPVFVGFGETVSSEFLLATASNTSNNRSVFQGRRSRGTLATPLVVSNNDYITSLLASAYDGSNFQNPALVSIFVDGTPTAGHVPARVSLVTGTNGSDRVERLKVGYTGNFDFNNGQVFLNQSTGFLGVGTNAPAYKLHSESTGTAIYGNSTSGAYGVWGNSTYLGVYGSGTTYGVYAYGSTGYGVYASGGNTGVYGSGGTYGLYGSGSSYGVYGSSSDGYGVGGVSTNSYGLYGSNTNNSWGSVAYGGYGGAYGSGDTYGAYGNSSSGSGVRGVSSTGYGVYGSSGYLGVWGTGDSYGLYGGGGTYGVYGTGSSYGVYGYSSSGNGGRFYSETGYGLWAETGRSDNNWAGVFQGNVYCYNAYQTSDKNLKKNIKDFDDAMTLINKLKPKNYEFKDDGKYASLHLPKGNHYGLLAQDLEQLLPNLVNESVHDLSFSKSKEVIPSADGKQATDLRKEPPTGTQKPPVAVVQKGSDKTESMTIKAVNYTELIPIIIKGMQELYADRDKKINDLQNQINELKALVQSLSTQNGHSTTAQSTTAFLKQNSPNPFNNNTIISYYIPDNAGYAQIKITDIKGSVIRTFNAAKGEGQINIRSGELAAGTYNYTLYINNQTIDTRQMVLLK